jgi:hypothetical protein
MILFLADYSCAFQREILVHGRMYLTQHNVCFYANIFKWETCLTIPFKDITHITKERTAKVIPNAIQVPISFHFSCCDFILLKRLSQSMILSISTMFT